MANQRGWDRDGWNSTPAWWENHDGWDSDRWDAHRSRGGSSSTGGDNPHGWSAANWNPHVNGAGPDNTAVAEVASEPPAVAAVAPPLGIETVRRNDGLSFYATGAVPTPVDLAVFVAPKPAPTVV